MNNSGGKCESGTGNQMYNKQTNNKQNKQGVISVQGSTMYYLWHI
jgi:hypothetical protein